MAVKVLEGCRYSRGTGKNHAAKSHGSRKTFTRLAARPLPADFQRLQDADHVRGQIARRVLVSGQLMQQGLLEQAVEHRVGHAGGDGHRDPGELGVPADDAPDHFLAALVDLQHVGPEGLLEQALVAQVVPQPVHRRVGSLARERLSSAGRPTPLAVVAIMDDDGKLLGPGQRGEIVVRGPLVMAGYYKNPAASAEAGRRGWHHTGDIGYLDDDQYLFIVDRAKDMIITGGFNVYSAEVEQVLLAHPAVQDCAVIGLPDEKWGERVTAVIQLRPGHSVTADEVQAFVKERLGSVKAPKQVEVWPDLPRSKVGKVLKPEIKAQLQGEVG